MEDENSAACEIQVVQGCLSGDGESVRTFVGLFRRSVYGLCYRLMRHHEDAEDIVQETFLRAIRSLHQWDQNRPLRPWLMTIAANRCKTALAKKSRRGEQVQQDLAETAETSEASSRFCREIAEEIDLCLVDLKPEQKLCFELFYREQLSCSEIALQLERPEGTIKTWLHRMRHSLAERLLQRGLNESVLDESK